jgi:predicted HAD superfamily Cof-like phosphohydrolase
MIYSRRDDAQISAVLVHDTFLMHNYYTYHYLDAQNILNIVHDANLMHNGCAYKKSFDKITLKNGLQPAA